MTTEVKERFFLHAIDDERMELSKIFENDHPVHIEIGSGRGEFLIEISQLEPEVNFLGLEIKGKRIKTIIKKLEPEKNSNVRLMRVMVNDSLLQLFPISSIERIYIFHPDPWPKRRHHKNRLIQESLLKEFERILKPGGDILITTDHQDYMEWIVKSFACDQDFISVYPEGFSREPFTGHIETHFEKKLKKKGFQPYYLKYIKK